MDTPKQLLDTRMNRVSRGRGLTSPAAFGVHETCDPALDIGADQRRQLQCPMAGLKPTADGIRNARPFGSPKREGRPERTSRNTGGVASSQLDPPQCGTGASAQRHGRWRDRSPLRLPECMDGPASPVSAPPPAAPREVRLNGFPGVLAEVPRHRCDDGGRRVPDAAPKGGSVAAYVAKPAYPPWPHSVCLPEGLAGGCAPCDPRNGNGAP